MRDAAIDALLPTPDTSVLAVGVLLIGLWPAPLLDITQASVQHLVQQVLTSKLPL